MTEEQLWEQLHDQLYSQVSHQVTRPIYDQLTALGYTRSTLNHIRDNAWSPACALAHELTWDHIRNLCYSDDPMESL